MGLITGWTLLHSASHNSGKQPILSCSLQLKQRSTWSYRGKHPLFTSKLPIPEYILHDTSLSSYSMPTIHLVFLCAIYIRPSFYARVDSIKLPTQNKTLPLSIWQFRYFSRLQGNPSDLNLVKKSFFLKSVLKAMNLGQLV